MNNKCKFLIVLSLIFMLATIQVQAEKYKGPIVKSQKAPKEDASCLAPSKTTELSLNMVRALLKTNGTMWFKEQAEYEIPKGSGKTSMFSSALWIGGVANGNLYLAAMRFAQVGNDFWTGPLKMTDGSINPSICAKYDKFYRMSRIEVERHKNAFINNDSDYKSNIPKSILEWPAIATEAGMSHYLAPFSKELNPGGDPTKYEPELGDFPYYDLPNELCPWTEENIERAKIKPWLDKPDGNVNDLGTYPNPKALPLTPERVWTRQHKDFGWDNKMIYADHVLKGDETVFWFLNDNGGPHGETKGVPIGLEIRVQAFAFSTNDEMNKMTFYSYEIINRGTSTLENTFFSQWVDPDLGYAWDDYVGCDVNRGLGYCYNGPEIDGTGQTFAYGANPPAVGVDFFQGPYIDADGSDNPKFDKNKADILAVGTDKEEYCKKFVHYIFQKWGKNGPTNLQDTLETHKIVVERENEKGVFDTLPIRWNNQYAINGVNFGDGIIDNERFGMRRFVYHSNTSDPATGDPSSAWDYYRLLQGIWKNNTPMTYGGTGYNPGSTLYADFMFPRNTDFCNWGTQGEDPGTSYFGGGNKGNWSEEAPTGEGSTANKPDDRRFMQSAGPFTLGKGACNYITVGIPWARATTGGVQASIALLRVADDKCQALFENCFKMLDGPDAPVLTIREYDQKLILLLSNPPISNNKSEYYEEKDPQIIHKEEMYTLGGLEKNDIDKKYRFEGYQIFQVSGPEVGSNDLDNPSLARLIFQCDIVNYDKKGAPIGRLINWEFDEDLQVSVPREKVNGSNTGIKHSFEVTQDAFASGARQLVNYKTYYFIAIAYAYNEYLPFYIDETSLVGLYGQKLPYLRGRKTPGGKSVTAIPAIPHPPYVHGGALTLYSDYGSIPNITRIDGQGNGGVALELTKETIDKIVRGGDKGDYRVRELEYEKNAGPLNIKVIDPLRVKPYEYTVFIREEDSIMNINSSDVSGNSYWVIRIEDVTDEELQNIGLVDEQGNVLREIVPNRYLKDVNGKDSVAIRRIGQYDEYIIFPLGLSVAISNADFINRQQQVVKNWDKILKACKNNAYKAKLRYCQSEKINIDKDIIYANGIPWITGLQDDNLPLPSNWIRAGSYNVNVWADGNTATHDGGVYKSKWYHEARLEDAFYPSWQIAKQDSPVTTSNYNIDRAFKDYSGTFGTLCNGTWAPYVLTSPYDGGPQAKYTTPEPYTETNKILEPGISYYWTYEFQWGLYPFEPMFPDRKSPQFPWIQQPAIHPGYNQTMTNLYSVDIVLTPNKDLWTRCVVLESCSDKTKSEGGALKNEPRKAKSVGKDGKPDGSTDGFGANGDEGMGWFPGYAINIETGERLNIMFSENSDKTFSQNPKLNQYIKGADMVFNPTSAYAIATRDINFFGFIAKEGDIISKNVYDNLYYNFDGVIDNKTGDLISPFGLLKDLGIERVWGGMHYVYVCNSAGNTSPIYYMNGTEDFDQFLNDARRNHNLNDAEIMFKYYQYSTAPPPARPLVYDSAKYGGFIYYEGIAAANKNKYPVYDCGPYDEGRWLVQKFKQFINRPEPDNYKPGPPWANGRFPHSDRRNNKMQLFNNVMYTHIPMQPADITLQNQWLSGDVTYKIRVTRPYLRYTSRWYESPDQRSYKDDIPQELDNRGFPIYKMSTKELAPKHNDTRVYQHVLDNINIVPNPYYGGSLYERNALDTKVKIINLPTDLKNGSPVTVNIFTVNGILVRTLTKGDSETSFIDWDLKNFANIPVAGGVYIIHVNCPGIGERMLKFFCTMRPTDLNTF